ncbi:MAG: hypothetical protein KDA73_09835 [Rhodobacteraceae bacterium]|nr:hypothetical protein [Paracoccaceae bacterium]
MWTIILPQAVRLVIGPNVNQAIGMRDLLTQAQQIYAANFLVMELLFVASIWYLGITTVASVGQHSLEKHFASKVSGA